MGFLSGSLNFTPRQAAAQPGGAAAVAEAHSAFEPRAAMPGAPGGVPSATADGAAAPTPEYNLASILKLVPAEVVAPFILGADKLKDTPGGVGIWFTICMLGPGFSFDTLVNILWPINVDTTLNY